MPFFRDDRAALQTGELTYTLESDGFWERASISFVYQNPTGRVLYQPACRPGGGEPGLNMGLQKWVDGAWAPVWGPVLPACLSAPIQVTPRGIYRGTLEVYTALQDTSIHPHFNPAVDVEGTYRLVWHDLLRTYDPDSYPFGIPLAAEDRVSNAFMITR